MGSLTHNVKGKAPEELWWLNVEKPDLRVHALEECCFAEKQYSHRKKENPENVPLKFSGYFKFTAKAL